MILIVVIALSMGLIVIGVKGFSSEGIPLTKVKTLRGKTGQLVGAVCVLGGILLTPAFFLVFHIIR